MAQNIIQKLQAEADRPDNGGAGYTVRLVLKNGREIHGAIYGVNDCDTSVAVEEWGDDGSLNQPLLHIAIDSIATARIEW